MPAPLGAARRIIGARVRCDEVFLHCPKAFMRSRLWQPQTWPARETLPTLGQMLRDHAKLADEPDEAAFQAQMRESLY